MQLAHLLLVLSTTYTYGLCVEEVLAIPNAQFDEGCEDFFYNKTVSWLAVWHNYAGAGTAYYSPEGFLSTWDTHGNIVNNGTYTVKKGPDGWCYEFEKYSYPPGAADTCNTFRIVPDVGGQTMIVGCEVFGDSCYITCNTDSVWKDWYVARSVGKGNVMMLYKN